MPRIARVFAAGLLFAGCSIPADRTAYYIAAPVGKRGGCQAVAQAVRSYALSAGYVLLEPPVKAPRRIATYVQPGYFTHRSIFVSCSERRSAEVEAAYAGDTDSWTARAERRKIFEYLQSSGFTSISLQQRRYRGMIDIIPFAP
jgi:hypothetical protein